jgi:predicted transposase YdaD
VAVGIKPPSTSDYTCGGSSPATSTPHDALFKAGFETPEQAVGLFKQVLPAPITRALAWETLARESGSFVDPALRKRQSDLLFSIQLARVPTREQDRPQQGKPVLLYLLLEHQSSNDADMPLRMLEYLVRIWKRYRKSHKKGSLPIIIPALLSNASGGWTAPTSFHELFDPEVLGAMLGLADLLPNFSLLLADLSTIGDDELLSWMLLPAASLILKALRDARDKEKFLRDLARWRGRVRDILAAPGGRDLIEQVLHYVWLVTPDLDFTDVHAKLLRELPEAEDAVMTFAERLREQGRAEGEAKGRLQVLTKLMAMKFGPVSDEHASRIATASAHQLDLYIERILLAATPEAMFSND